jgi:hypothetical protein
MDALLHAYKSQDLAQSLIKFSPGTTSHAPHVECWQHHRAHALYIGSSTGLNSKPLGIVRFFHWIVQLRIGGGCRGTFRIRNLFVTRVEISAFAID